MSEEQQRKLADYLMRPETKAAMAVYMHTPIDSKLSFGDLAKVLEGQIHGVRSGKCLSQMLASQALTLDAIFYKLLERSVEHTSSGRTAINAQTFNLALKCQKQSAGTALLLSSLTEKKLGSN